MCVDRTVAGGPHHHHGLRSTAVAILLATAAVPAHASNAGATGSAATGNGAAAAQSQPTDPQNEPIVITGQAFHDVVPERVLDQDGIESYGVSTIDELLAEVQSELGDDEEPPLIIVNGHRIGDASEIGSLPVEALRNLVVLPRGAAIKAGGKSNQRVISLSLRPTVKSATVTGAEKIATEGQWHAERGELILTRVHGDTRANITFRKRNERNLLEAERGIVQPDPLRPYALAGNIVGYPFSEIDPALSALAGEPVTIVPFPGSANPILADLVGKANQAATTDIGQYRTLRPQTRNYDINATFSTQVRSWLNATGTVRWNRTDSNGLRGLPGMFFVLPPTNPASPFANSVGLAVYGPTPLTYFSRSSGGEGDLTLDAKFGSWTANLQARHQIFDYNSRSQRVADTMLTLPDDINPFAGDLASLFGIVTDEASSHTANDILDLTVAGPIVNLPAGQVDAVFEGELDWSRLRSASTYTPDNPVQNFSRDQQSIRGALDIPLTSRDNHFLGAIGNVDATVEYSRVHFSDAGSLDHHALGLTWRPIQPLRLRGSIDVTKAPAPIQSLGDPVIVTPDVRTFDPLTGDTVDVTQIIGGNPSLLPQTTTIRNLSAQWQVMQKFNLQLTADYFDTDRRNFLSSLPAASAAVMLAFPDRFVRDANGVLTTVDLRPVNFDSDREKRLRWGFTLSKKIGGGRRPPEPVVPGHPRLPSRAHPSTLIQLTVNHTIVFSEQIQIRPGLDPVDVLAGGAIGISGGRLRHQADATASITSGGMGARLGLTYRGRSSLVTRLSTGTDTVEFSPLFTANLRLFADAKRIFPNSKAARGFRLSLDLLNLTDGRQRVHDSYGVTPIQFQPAYRDPIGRTIEIELRKVF